MLFINSARFGTKPYLYDYCLLYLALLRYFCFFNSSRSRWRLAFLLLILFFSEGFIYCVQRSRYSSTIPSFLHFLLNLRISLSEDSLRRARTETLTAAIFYFFIPFDSVFQAPPEVAKRSPMSTPASVGSPRSTDPAFGCAC